MKWIGTFQTSTEPSFSFAETQLANYTCYDDFSLAVGLVFGELHASAVLNVVPMEAQKLSTKGFNLFATDAKAMPLSHWKNDSSRPRNLSSCFQLQISRHSFKVAAVQVA